MKRIMNTYIKPDIETVFMPEHLMLGASDGNGDPDNFNKEKDIEPGGDVDDGDFAKEAAQWSSVWDD
jgi:hypothetical protein